MKTKLPVDLISMLRQLPVYFVFLGIMVTGSGTGIALGASRTIQVHATSKSLLVYQNPDLSSEIVGRLIYDELIIVQIKFEKLDKTGLWLKINAPYDGYYLKTSTDPASPDTDSQSRQSHFRKSGEAPQPDEEKQMDKTPEQKTPQEVSGDKDKEETADARSEDEVSARPAEQADDEKPKPIESPDESPFWLRDKKKQTIIGLGGGIMDIQEEDGYSGSGTPTDLFLEIMGRGSFLSKLRFGTNSISAEGDNLKIDTSTFFTAFRVKPDQITFDNVQVFVLGGLAWMQSKLSGEDSGKYEGLGVVYGGGATYSLFNSMGLGGQLVTFMKQADFGSRKVSIGSTQIQAIVSYAF